MKNHKKNLWLLALVGALALLFASGCTGGDTGGDNPPAETKNTKIYEWKKVAKADFMTDDNVHAIEVSRDGNFVYFNSDNKKVRVADVTGITFDKATEDKAKFTDAPLLTSNLDDNTAGKAKVDGSNVLMITPTRSGALLNLETTSNPQGIVYIKGKAQTEIGWINDGGTGTHFKVTADADDFITAYSVEGNGAEYVYICGTESCATALKNKVDLKTDKTNVLDKYLTNKGTAIFTGAIVVSTGSDAWVVAEQGVAKIPEAKLGDKFELPDELNTGTPNRGSNHWKTKDDKGKENIPADAIFVDKKIYIRFVAVKDGGGVDVVDTTADGGNGKIVGFTDEAWKDMEVIDFAVHGTNVFAVTPTGLFMVKPDGKKGDQLTTNRDIPADNDFDKAKENAVYDKGAAMPTKNITGAKFVGDTLIITTSDAGVFYRLPAVDKKYTKN